ncbi:hypothetical protein JCM10914A_51510 [Paenibacillus sp. JCM 10914]
MLIGCGTDANQLIHGEMQEGVSIHETFQAVVIEQDETTITVDNSGSKYRLITKDIDYVAEVGDQVKVWTTEQYEESNPAQGEAIKIEKVK